MLRQPSITSAGLGLRVEGVRIVAVEVMRKRVYEPVRYSVPNDGFHTRPTLRQTLETLLQGQRLHKVLWFSLGFVPPSMLLTNQVRPFSVEHLSLDVKHVELRLKRRAAVRSGSLVESEA